MESRDEPLVAKLYLWDHECWLEQGIGTVVFEEDQSTKTSTVRLLHVTSSTPLLCFVIEPDPLCFLLPHMFTESAWVLTVNDASRETTVQCRVALIFQTTQESQRFRVLFDRAKKQKRAATQMGRLQAGQWARNVERG